MGKGVIYRAVKKSDLNLLSSYLEENIDIEEEYACTALHYACREGNLEIIDFLLKNGADSNKKNNYATKYPLFEAINSNKIEMRLPMIKRLISYGAEIDSIDSFGNTLLHHATEQGNRALVTFLIDSKIDINKTQRHDKDRALHYTCFKKNRELFSQLIEAGADREALNINGKRAEDYLYP